MLIWELRWDVRELVDFDALKDYSAMDRALLGFWFAVTVTSQAVMALKLLRENKDKFDLVISDVQMPDMDGFNLLELVGLEMDLPVIMLSAYGDTKLVMKGITHGACDYLLKPVRMEELKNIWQHVVRRKKANPQDQYICNNGDFVCYGSGGEGNKSAGMKNYEQYGKMVRKRKDQNEEEEEYDENGAENDDPSSQKKARVVWSVELHRKFVAAVNAIGFDKAVPKKILELMNVDKLSRENVASHLQKYRLYLKRLNTIANQQANMVAALGGADSAYLHMGVATFHDFSSSLQLQNNSLISIPSPAPGMVGRLNAPAGLAGLHGLSPSGVLPSGQAHIPRSAIDGSRKLEPSLSPEDSAGSILQGMPTTFEFDQLQHRNASSSPGELLIANGDSMFIPKSTPSNVICGTRNPLMGPTGNSLVLEENTQDVQTRGANVSPSSTTNSPKPSRCYGNWTSSLQPSFVKSTSFASNDGYQPAFQRVVSSRDGIPMQLSGDMPEPSMVQNSRLDTQCQATLLSYDIVQDMISAPKQGWGKHNLNVFDQPDFINGSMDTPVAAIHGPCPSRQGMGLNRNTDVGLIGYPELDSFTRQWNMVESGSAMQAATKLKQGYDLMDYGRPFGGYSVYGSGSLEDVVTEMVKREPDGAAIRETCI